jgi:YesN/AraC family two-component response regulator
MKTTMQNHENPSNLKVLLVDDDSDILDLLAEIISERGFHAIKANNGKAGLDLLMKEKPCLVLTDIQMPKMDGVTLAKAVKSMNKNTPVILISGQYPNLMADKMSHKFECDHILYKPFSKSDVIESIHLFLPDQIRRS